MFVTNLVNHAANRSKLTISGGEETAVLRPARIPANERLPVHDGVKSNVVREHFAAPHKESVPIEFQRHDLATHHHDKSVLLDCDSE